MRSPQLDPTMTRTLTCLHMRLIDRVPPNDDKEPSRYRCLECGAIIEDRVPQARPSAYPDASGRRYKARSTAQFGSQSVRLPARGSDPWPPAFVLPIPASFQCTNDVDTVSGGAQIDTCR